MLNSTFYVERLTTKGSIITEYVEATSLREVDGRLYIYGWCSMMPGYRSVPVDRIVNLTDEQTRQTVLHDDVADWLKNRSLH